MCVRVCVWMPLDILSLLNSRYKKFPLYLQISRSLQNIVALKCYVNDTPSLHTYRRKIWIEEPSILSTNNKRRNLF